MVASVVVFAPSIYFSPADVAVFWENLAGIPIITPRARAAFFAFFASIGNLLRQLLWKGGPNISAIEGDEGHEGNEGVESHKGY